jgi:hypothetical protein
MKEFIDAFENSQGTVADFNRIFINNNELKGFKCDTNVSIGEMEIGERRAITIGDKTTLYFSLLSPKTVSINYDTKRNFKRFMQKLKSPNRLGNKDLKFRLLDKIKTQEFVEMTKLMEELNASKHRIYEELRKLIRDKIVHVIKEGRRFRIIHEQ